MTKLGVITDGISREFEHALAVMNEFGLEYAELQFVWDKEVGDHSDAQIARMQELIKNGKGFISGLIFGTNSEICTGEMGEIESKVIENEGIQQEQFNITSISNVSSKGMRREILSPIFDLKWRITKDKAEEVLNLDFSLFRGTYATSFMREIMKGTVLYY